MSLLHYDLGSGSFFFHFLGDKNNFNSREGSLQLKKREAKKIQAVRVNTVNDIFNANTHQTFFHSSLVNFVLSSRLEKASHAPLCCLKDLLVYRENYLGICKIGKRKRQLQFEVSNLIVFTAFFFLQPLLSLLRKILSMCYFQISNAIHCTSYSRKALHSLTYITLTYQVNLTQSTLMNLPLFHVVKNSYTTHILSPDKHCNPNSNTTKTWHFKLGPESQTASSKFQTWEVTLE